MRSLVVDDEFVALSKMVLMLSPYGQCDAATNGEQAMSMLRNALDQGEPYDLIALDINMPGTNGLQLLQTINCEEQCRKTPRARKIIVSAASSRSNVTRAVERRCDAFLVKPVSRDVLAATLQKLGLLEGDPAESAAENRSEEPAASATT